jgi:hypothetical protein
MDGTIFMDVDLSAVRGLEVVEHFGPSGIDISTIYRSKGNIPEAFLRGAGIPDSFLTFMQSLVTYPIDYNTCFISYSSKDQAFAERLYADLQKKGVRCWFAPEDMKIGDKIRARIDEAIHTYDKLLLVLSENSFSDARIQEEVETAFEREHRQDKLILFPIRLDDTVLKTSQKWATDILRTRNVSNFSEWKDPDHYQKAFSRLIRDLIAGD